MPRLLAPIPSNTQIVEPKDGTITTFFRLLWQQLVTSAVVTPTQAVLADAGLNAAVATANAFVVQTSGWYRVSYYLRKTAADGVNSSLTMTLGWTDHALPLSQTFAALTLDTTAAFQSGSILVYADANSALTYAIAYASNTPGAMTYNRGVITEQLD